MLKGPCNRRQLIIFTRYPAPGKTKTRLIPSLGPAGAAEVQRRMTEHVVRRAWEFSLERSAFIEIRYEGGGKHLMERWLGRRFTYRRQGAGDIGARMARVFQESFAGGAERIVLIGADCPGVTVGILHDAFNALDVNDVVLGPAHDGGYYLIGLRRPIDELFMRVPWGGRQVRERTMQIAGNLGCSIGVLKALDDVDNPEDLPVWEREERCAQEDLRSKRISIIIPTLNEALTIAGTLERLHNVQNVETIVVDGGSSDNTVEVAESFGVKVIRTSTGRARQMNEGAAAATGEILLFLHADTRLPDKFDEHVRRILMSPETVGGAFRLSIDAPNASLRLIELLANWRGQWLQMPYGDQGLFLKAALFSKMGGFPDMPIMEDFVFIRQLRKWGTIAIAPVPVVTSARRWLGLGVWRTTLINQCMLAAYHAGVPLQTLARLYKGARSNRESHAKIIQPSRK
jgi:hypothetical protein